MPLTILWVVAIANAVNLVDGLDGLAAGMMAIAAAAFFVYIDPHAEHVRRRLGRGDAVGGRRRHVPRASCRGTSIPAKIFMGDSGSLLLGMLLSIATIDGVGRNPFEPSGGDIAAIAGVLVVPLLVLFIPFLDVVLAIARRTWRGQGIGHADKEHIHHRLMDIGHSHPRAVLLMYLWSALISASALAVGLIDGRATVGLILLARPGAVPGDGTARARPMAPPRRRARRRRCPSAPAPPGSEPSVDERRPAGPCPFRTSGR